MTWLSKRVKYMSQQVLKVDDNVVPEFTLRPLHTSEMHSNTEDKKRELFDELTDGRWRTSINTPPVSRKKPEDFEEHMDENEVTGVISEIE